MDDRMEKEPTRWIIEGKKAKERNKEGEKISYYANAESVSQPCLRKCVSMNRESQLQG
jgi:hypothetical protein